MRYLNLTARAAVAAIILTLALPAAAEAAPAPLEASTVQKDSDRAIRVERPNRGGAGRFGDSNVYGVWRGASFAERSFWRCVRNHESRHSGHYRAENGGPYGGSSASGAGQWLNGTWDGVKVWVKWRGQKVAVQYDEAKDAPAWVQDLVFRHVWKHGGQSMWRGTNCGYGT